MNITEALADVAASFSRSLEEAGAPFDVSSGGVKKSAREHEPALCLTSDLAIRMWRDEMMKLLGQEKATGFSVIDGPYLDKWNITVADGKYTHRIAEQRYSVTARVGVIRTPQVADNVAEEATSQPAVAIVDGPKVSMKFSTDGGQTWSAPEGDAAPLVPKPKPAKAAKKKAA